MSAPASAARRPEMGAARAAPRALSPPICRASSASSSLACPCGRGQMVRIGEDRSSRLDVTPAQYRVVETVRPRYACPKGCAGVAQAPAPAHLIEGGTPTEALLAQVAVAKFSAHMPLYRQSQVFARHGIQLGISRGCPQPERRAIRCGARRKNAVMPCPHTDAHHPRERLPRPWLRPCRRLRR